MRHTVVIGSGLCAVLALGGCSISDSISASISSISESLAKGSESVSDSSQSFSDSSGGGDSSSPTTSSLRRDLRAYGVAFVEGEGGSDAFLRGVGRVAEAHGVTNWEAAPGMLVAVGEGLRDASVPADVVRARLDGMDPEALGLVLAPIEARTP